MKQRSRIVTTSVYSSLLLLLCAPGIALAGSDVIHPEDVYVEGKMCLGSESELTSGPCDISTSTAPLHVLRDAGTAENLLHLENSGPTKLMIENTDVGNPATSVQWLLNSAANGHFRISDADTIANVEFELQDDGDLLISGSLMTGSRQIPDYVFEEDYLLMPLDELAAFIREHKHLPNVPSNAEVQKAGHIDMSSLQLRLLEKVEELTLYTLAQEERLGERDDVIAALTERLVELEPSSSDED